MQRTVHLSPSAEGDGGLPKRRGARSLLIAILAVAALVGLAHGPVINARGLALDDALFVGDNPLVMQPSWSSARRFFAEVLEPSTVNAYYLPLTMTSLMLDAALGGRADEPRVFHVTSLAFHLLATVLLLLVLHQLFGALVPAALVALLFGLHPLTVEPIASIGERKTVLSTALAFASVLAYVLHARGRGRGWLATALGFFLLALLSKPSVLALPLVLVLLAVWPLRRPARVAAVEMLPFAALALAFAIISVLSVARTWEFGALPHTSVERVALQICHLHAFYLGKIVWPASLSPMYAPPEPFSLTDPQILIAVAVVVAITASTLLLARRTPGPLVGWLVFVVALAPTLTIIRFGGVIAYDRYVYFPVLGPVLVLGWALAAAWQLQALRSAAAKGIVIGLVLVIGVTETRLLRMTIGHWQDSVTLWRHIVASAPRRPEAHNGLGTLLFERAEGAAAIERFRRAIELDPGFGDAHLNLGIALSAFGEDEEAIRHLSIASALAPRSPSAAIQLGIAAQRAGQLGHAAAQFQRALQLRPGGIDGMTHLGVVRVLQGRREQGITLLRAALAQAPDDAQAHFSLAAVLIHSGHEAEALDHLRQAVRARPDWAPPLNELAWRLATHPDFRDPSEALRLADRAVALSQGRDASALDTRAAALAALGRFDEAAAVAREALALALRRPGDPLGATIRDRIELYVRRAQVTERPTDPAAASPATGR